MPPSSHPPQKPPTEHTLLLNIARRATIFVSPDFQPHATIPLNGNTVPIASPTFRTWLSQAFEERGFIPSPAQTGAVLRKLCEDALAYPIIQPVHIRTAPSAPHTYRLDLANPASEAIEINGKEWTTVYNLDCRFRRPLASIAYPTPENTEAPFHKFLERLFHLSEPIAQALSTWMVAAMLPDLTPPILVITGSASDVAVRKLRTILDPVTCPIHALPTTKQQFGQLAFSNRVLAFSIGKRITESCRETLNKLRTGLPVRLQNPTKTHDLIETTLHRPIIISAETEIEIGPHQLTIEINETSETALDKVFAALLDAVVRGIHEMTRQSMPEPFTDYDVLQMPSQQRPQTPAPYT